MKCILCLDFDGVICDSMDETLLVSYIAYNRFEKRSETAITDLRQIPVEIADSFRSYRMFVRPPGEYWLLMRLLHAGRDNLTQDVFDGLIEENKEKINAFEECFFNTRKEVMDNDPDVWYGLHKIYSQFSEAWPELNRDYDVYIVTTKNYEAVSGLLRYFKIMIPDGRILAKEFIKDKRSAVEEISGKNNVSSSDILFVDDHPLHLKSIAESGAKCFLAGWGYNNENPENKIEHLKEILV